MQHKHIAAAVATLLFVIIGMFIFAYLKKTELSETTIPAPLEHETESENTYTDITRIDARHFFENGKHTIVGEILMPTPCDLLNWTTRTVPTQPNLVVVDFDVVNHSKTCSQVVTPQRFKVSFEAVENIRIEATLEKRPLEVNLIQAGAGESPDDFELFIKG